MFQKQLQAGDHKTCGSFSVRITTFGSNGFKKITRRNHRIEDEINRLMEKLGRNPEMGRELTADLHGMRAVASADKEYRIVYELEESKKEVIIHAIGHRKKVYDSLARILKRVMPYGDRQRDRHPHQLLRGVHQVIRGETD